MGLTNENPNLNTHTRTAVGVFESNEPIYNPLYLRYPLNAFTSIFYWVPLLYIPFSHKIDSNLLGISILTCLAPVSFIWWATSNPCIKYIDNGLVLSTKLWLISVITNHPEINVLIPLFFCINRDKLIKNLAFTGSCALLWYNPNNISRGLFSISLLGKLSDSYLGNIYGTSIFHVFSGLAIAVYFKD